MNRLQNYVSWARRLWTDHLRIYRHTLTEFLYLPA